MSFDNVLIHWYSTHKRNLPWRQTRDPYFIWLSEIILQQTQVKQGLPYYEKFVNNYPTVFDLAEDSEEGVLKNWQGLGYYSRARNLHHTAKYVAYQLHGEFPDTYAKLVQLKGIGDYTASAIASIAFNESKAVLDGNVFRVLSRYFGISEPINSTEGLKVFKPLSQSLINKDKPGDYNQSIMEFGALQCKPVNPDCSSCPLQDSCVARKKGLAAELPVKLKKTKVLKKYYNYMVCIDPRGNTLIEKRSSKGIWHNLYQFPLVESPNSLDPSSFEEITKASPFESEALTDIFAYNSKDLVHKLSHRELHTKFWVLILKDPLQNGVSFNVLENYPVPVLIAKFIEEFDHKNACAQFF